MLLIFQKTKFLEQTEELDLYMNLRYKQGIEVAEETAIKTYLKLNDYEEI